MKHRRARDARRSGKRDKETEGAGERESCAPDEVEFIHDGVRKFSDGPLVDEKEFEVFKLLDTCVAVVDDLSDVVQ